LNGSHRVKYIVLLAAILTALVGQLFPGNHVAAQSSENWDIIIDTSINEGAITGTVSNVYRGTEGISGDIVLKNNAALWWKVYLTEIPEDMIDVDTSGLFFDEVQNKSYFYLAPLGSSNSDALPTLPPSVTFHQAPAGLCFYADRTIESGYEALTLQVVEIALIALTGSGVPTSAVGLILDTLDAPPFLTIAEGLAETPVNFWKVAEGLGSIAHNQLALNQLQYVLAHLGVSMTISEIQQVFVFWSIVQLLRIIYDTLTSPVADNVIFRVIETGDEPISADINCSPSSGAVPLSVNFDASDSYSPQYPIISYNWDFGDNEYGTGMTETHTYYQAGEYNVTLTITDDHGRQSIATRTIIVWPTGIQVTAGGEQFNLVFEAEESPGIVAYSWDFGDGNQSNDRVTSNTYSSPGEYIVSLSLGLNTGDATEGWIPWVGRDVIKVFLQTDSSPAGWSFTVDKYDDAPDTIMVDGIIVQDADEVWTNTMVASTDLHQVAQAVAPRIIFEYGDSLVTLDLVSSDDLAGAAIAVSPRITFEYADSASTSLLIESAELSQVASEVTPRVIAEYSDSIYHPDLKYPVGLDQSAASVNPRIIVEYADMIFGTVITAPNLPINQYSLTINSTDGGNVTTPGEGTFTCNASEVVDLVATADPNYTFVNWIGDTGTIDDVDAANTTITMDDDYSITGEFTPGWVPYVPTSEQVTIAPVTSEAMTSVEVTLEFPTVGYRVEDWGSVQRVGNEFSVDAKIERWTGFVIMIVPVPYEYKYELGELSGGNYKFTFKAWGHPVESKQFTLCDLTISSTAGGSVTTPGEGTFTRNASEVVALVATADANYTFVNWTGDVSTIGDVNSATTNITMNGNYSIVANFTAGGAAPVANFSANVTGGPPPLAVQFTDLSTNIPTNWSWDFGDGNTSNLQHPVNIYAEGTYNVSLNASNAYGWNVTTKLNYITVTSQTYNLTIDSTDGGNVTTPGEGEFGPYNHGGVVGLDATADTNYTFVNWTGDTGTIDNANAANTTITMTGNYSIVANFAAVTGATLEGNVTFLGRGVAPNSTWIEDFMVRFYEGGNETAWSPLNASTNASGGFIINGITPGTYGIKIKGMTSVSVLESNVTLTAGVTTPVDFGTLREGDCNGDNWVTGADRNLLYTGWGSTVGDDNWNPDCDLNRDDWLTGADRNLMYTYWGQHGDLV